MIVYFLQEVVDIKCSILSEKSAVNAFLIELKMILCGNDFDIEEDLLLIKSWKEKMKYSTPYTLVDLEYDSHDVVERLRELTLQEYSETLVDRQNDNPPFLFVFGKEIAGRQVYIKLKIKNERRRKVLCLSFHYAEYQMKFPYA